MESHVTADYPAILTLSPALFKVLIFHCCAAKHSWGGVTEPFGLSGGERLWNMDQQEMYLYLLFNGYLGSACASLFDPNGRLLRNLWIWNGQRLNSSLAEKVSNFKRTKSSHFSSSSSNGFRIFINIATSLRNMMIFQFIFSIITSLKMLWHHFHRKHVGCIFSGLSLGTQPCFTNYSSIHAWKLQFSLSSCEGTHLVRVSGSSCVEWHMALNWETKKS